MDAAFIREAINNKFTDPEWEVYHEVANGTGQQCTRHADVIMMNMYPSRGLDIVGIEIKVSRSDLKHELDNPEKAEAMAQYCNTWYLCTPQGLINDTDIIPRGWGIMEVSDNGKIKKKKESDYRKDVVITKKFLAAMIRSNGSRNRQELGQLRWEIKEEVYKEFKADIDARVERELSMRSNTNKEAIEMYERLQKILGWRTQVLHDTEIETLKKVIDGVISMNNIACIFQNISCQMNNAIKDIKNGDVEICGK